MSVKIYDSTIGAFKDATPMIWDEQAQAWKDSVGLVWNEQVQAWEDRWGGDNNELVIFENGKFKNLPDNSWQDVVVKAEWSRVKISINNGLLLTQGGGTSHTGIVQRNPIDISEYKKVYIDMVETNSSASYSAITLTFDHNRTMCYWLKKETDLNGIEVRFEDFTNYDYKFMKQACIGFYINYSYYAKFRKISFRK